MSFKCNLDIDCNECGYKDNYNCPDIPMGKVIKEYKYKGRKYSLCEGTHGKKYDLWQYNDFKKDWWVIKSRDNKRKTKIN
jgi:hypothetical protein